ncbi:hypothetical protein U771_26470 [Pseudomonas gorinensis]|uniref:Uncharacterized protein n=1 Tax=Pseudomonas gorinensis TaxID=3240790 RepID=A0ACA7PCK9_9PSED|nr:hypothetical protein U771_26470 [Pseudomonas sp. TKP]
MRLPRVLSSKGEAGAFTVDDLVQMARISGLSLIFAQGILAQALCARQTSEPGLPGFD